MAREEKRRFVGIDLGKRTYSVAFCVEGEDYKLSNGKTSVDGRLALYKKLKPTDTVALEAGNMAFIFAVELQKTVGCAGDVLNSSRLLFICRSEKKTDKEDCKKLAWAVRRFPREELPVVAVPSEQEMKRRKLVRSYDRAKRLRTKLVNQMHSLFVSQGITTVVKSDLATAKDRDEAIKMLTGLEREEADWLAVEIASCEGRVKHLEGLMKADAKGDEKIERLQQVPGVGEKTSYAFTAYVNEERFRNGSEVSNFLGLVPRVYMSGDTNHYGKITKRGNRYLRSLLVEASWVLVYSKTDSALKQRYRYMTETKGMGKKTAIVAIARRLAVLLYTLLKSKTDFEPRRFTPSEERRVKLAEKLAEEALAA
jgi:transposase